MLALESDAFKAIVLSVVVVLAFLASQAGPTPFKWGVPHRAGVRQSEGFFGSSVWATLQDILGNFAPAWRILGLGLRIQSSGFRV